MENEIQEACRKKSILGVPKVDFKVDFFGLKSRFKSIKMALWLPNFKGRACNLDFPALHESNFAAYFTGCQLFWTQKSIISRKVEKVNYKYRFFRLKMT